MLKGIHVHVDDCMNGGLLRNYPKIVIEERIITGQGLAKVWITWLGRNKATIEWNTVNY